MIEVRFTPKGSIQECVFSPVRGEDDKWYLFSKLSDGKDVRYQLKQDDESNVFSLVDESVFEESHEVIEERLLGVSEELMGELAQGFEVESNNEQQRQPGYGPDDIFVENKPFSLKQINDLIDEGDIELSPDFQRNFIWDNTRQSRLIESIFLGLPLPSIYLSQYKDGRLTIVDGLQRIMTIRRFLRNELCLNNLEYIQECNGKTFNQLQAVFSPLRLRRFGQTQIMCFVIDYRSPTKLKFDLFRRLNTGGKPLNNQEIRNCLSRPQLRNALKSIVTTDAFKNATGNSVKDTRMEAQEAALRFICFYTHFNNESDPFPFYNGNMDEILDNAVEELGEVNNITSILSIYEQALKDAYSLFGLNTFRKVFPVQIRRNPVNKLLMLTVCLLLAKFGKQYRKKIECGYSLTNQLAILTKDDFLLFNALTFSTNSKWNIEYTFKTLKNKLFDQFLLTHE